MVESIQSQDNIHYIESDIERKMHHTQAMLYEQLKDLVIEWHQCRLRSIQASDIHDIYLGASHPEVYQKRLTRKKEWYDIQDAACFIDYVDSEHQKAQKRILWIEFKGKIVGIVSLTKNEFPYDVSAFLWVWVNPEFQGKWLAKEALSLLVDNALQLFPNLIRIEARLFASNVAIPNILDKLWFIKEAKLHNRILYKWQIMDEIMYAKYMQ